MTRRRTKSVNLSKSSVTELSTISQRSISNEEVKHNQNRWRDIIHSKRYDRDHGSTTCILQ